MKFHAAHRSLTCCGLLWFGLPCSALLGQEASSGIDLRATVGVEALYSHELTQSPRDGSPGAAGIRSLLYPTWKIGEHWTFSGAVQVISRPWFAEDFSTQGYGLRVQILHADLAYSKVWEKGSIVLRAGQLSSAFGAFLLRYDDADNPLLQMPMGYGYYYDPVTTAGLAGVQADVTLGKWDARAQLVNSSPANPRSIFARDQYGNWAGGIGYTIRQGFRVGISAYRGPYLDRQNRFFFRGESEPKDLPATALGADVQWARGHWNLYGEWQHFEMNYHAIPTFRENGAYFEAKRVLHPRWYVAARTGFLHTTYQGGGETYELSAGFRPNSWQLIKTGYMIERYRNSGEVDRTFGVQLVTMLHPLSLAWH
jgi:hypothetical protein